jgi:hypothetical protein
VNVVTPLAERRKHNRSCKPVSIEIVVHVFTLERPARREHVFQAAAYRVTVAVGAIKGSKERSAAEKQVVTSFGEGIAALGIQQSRPQGITDPASYRTQRPLIVVVDKSAGRACRKDEAVVVVPDQPAVLAFDADAKLLPAN